MPTFDGDNLIVTLDAGTPTVNVQVDLYSDAKEWFKTGANSKYHFPFSTEGGTTTVPGESSGRNYFFQNQFGWRIRPAEEDAEIVIEGNLFKGDTTLPMFIPTIGNFTVLVQTQRSSLSLIEESGISGMTAEEAAIFAKFANIEGGLDIQQVQRLILSAVQGILTGAEPTSSEIITKSLDGKTDRLKVTKDAHGNRDSVIRNPN